MNFRELLHEHIENHVNSFYLLNQSQKRILCIYALLSNEFDTYNLFIQHDGEKFYDLIKKCILDKCITAEKALEKTLDEIIFYNASLFDEAFDDEFERYINNQIESVHIVRSKNGSTYYRALGV